MADGTLNIFRIAGSLRSGSYNRALLRAAVEVMIGAQHLRHLRGYRCSTRTWRPRATRPRWAT
ncbi:MAG: hypothetical protein R2716_00375 [Microthrixaceae bacterium]